VLPPPAPAASVADVENSTPRDEEPSAECPARGTERVTTALCAKVTSSCRPARWAAYSRANETPRWTLCGRAVSSLAADAKAYQRTSAAAGDGRGPAAWPSKIWSDPFDARASDAELVLEGPVPFTVASLAGPARARLAYRRAATTSERGGMISVAGENSSLARETVITPSVVSPARSNEKSPTMPCSMRVWLSSLAI
jgi:hypothetical protein